MPQGQAVKVKKKKKSVLKNIRRTLPENTANRYKSRLTLALNGLKAKKA
jgi:hypothetical protein